MATKLTMTVQEVYLAMREAGIVCTPMRIIDGIQSGLYPFGIVTNVGETGRRTVLIYRVDFEAWLQTKIPQSAARQEQYTPPLRMVHSM